MNSANSTVEYFLLIFTLSHLQVALGS
jgi:hypothetical protein